ncbi:MAG: SDR family oxidoreductase [Pseudomonadota bacterium]
MAGKTALITGGAKRIGHAISSYLAQSGYDVAIHCNASRAAGDALAEKINSEGGRAHVVVADLSDPKAVADIVPQAIEAIGPLSLLVNNASVFEADDLETMTPESWAFHHDVNLRAPIFLSQAFAAQVEPNQDGLIVNIIDQRVLKLTPEFFSYQLTKSALWVATRTMAQSLAPRIRVNAISPGPTLQNARQRPEDFQAQIDGVLLKRGPDLDEFGRTIVYLDETQSITGQMICLDGGQHLVWQTPDIAGIPE